MVSDDPHVAYCALERDLLGVSRASCPPVGRAVAVAQLWTQEMVRADEMSARGVEGAPAGGRRWVCCEAQVDE